MRPPRVLTWHVHGNYMLYLSQANAAFYLSVQKGKPGSGGRGDTFLFGPNVHDIPADTVREEDFDLILFQNRQNYEVDQYELLSDEQRRLPKVYIQHDPPWEDPTDELHWFDDPNGLLVHVTPFNALMWDSGRTPSKAIDHGVCLPRGVEYSGHLHRGIAVVNHLKKRGRKLGADVFERNCGPTTRPQMCS